MLRTRAEGLRTPELHQMDIGLRRTSFKLHESSWLSC